MFPSFIGKDTRDDFTSHLYDAVYNRVETFLANELEKGEEITPVLLRTLEESRILVIIFPEGYEFSSWCVDELVKMLECKMKKYGQIVLSEFYHINPSDVEVDEQTRGKNQENPDEPLKPDLIIKT